MAEYERLLRYQRLAAFNKLARKIGTDVEKSGLTEEQLMAELEETKLDAFREQSSFVHGFHGQTRIF